MEAVVEVFREANLKAEIRPKAGLKELECRACDQKLEEMMGVAIDVVAIRVKLY